MKLVDHLLVFARKGPDSPKSLLPLAWIIHLRPLTFEDASDADDNDFVAHSGSSLDSLSDNTSDIQELTNAEVSFHFPRC